MIEIVINNQIYRLGRNAIENFKLIDDSHPEDWWFHIDGFPSGHCVVSSLENLIINKEIKKTAGALVKSYSKYKDLKKVKIVFTQIKYIVKTKNIGEVIIKNESSFFI